MFPLFPCQYLVYHFHSSVKCIFYFHCDCMIERVSAVLCMFEKCRLQKMVNNVCMKVTLKYENLPEKRSTRTGLPEVGARKKI